MEIKVDVALIMGSQSDYDTMRHCEELLKNFGIPYEMKIISAHRTPDKMYGYAKLAKSRGIKLIIAAAGGAAHLPGMVSSVCSLPVIGVPISSRYLQGVDSLYSIVQMPAGVPVMTMAIGVAGAKNAAIAALRILVLFDEDRYSVVLSDYNCKLSLVDSEVETGK